MAEKKRVPKVRFHEYYDEWQQIDGGSIFGIKDDRNHPELPVLAASQELGMVQRCKINYDISYDKKNAITYKRVMPGQFVIHLRSFQGGFAHSETEGITSPAYTVMDFKEKENHDDYYWKYVLTSTGFIKRLETVTYGIRDGRSISYDDFSELLFSFPEVEEQKKIGELLSQLNQLITQEQAKHEKLQNLQKAMLEKMFPKDGEDMPGIRIKGFTGAWTQCKVGEVTEELKQYTTFQSGFPLLTSSRSGLMMQNEYRDNTSTDNQDTLFSVVPMGACTYRHMSDDDIFHFNINEIVEKGLVSREYPVFTASKGNNLFVVIQYLNSSAKFRAFCREQKMGGTRTRLYYKTLRTFDLLLPSEKEQDQIAAALKKIDVHITLHQQELEKIKNLKKALLERMFV